MITICGASDDLIEIEGDVREEFNVGGESRLLAFSDGTVLRVEYTPAAVWRVTPVRAGGGHLDVVHAPEDDEDDYSDRATLTGPDDEPIEWVVLGTEVATRKHHRAVTA